MKGKLDYYNYYFDCFKVILISDLLCCIYAFDAAKPIFKIVGLIAL